MKTQVSSINAADVTRQTERIAGSRPFANARRSQRLLRYLVETALADPLQNVKEYTLATDVFDRDESYDPAVDATVRVEAGRLRSRLREYYSEEGREDALLIELPKGGYRVAFSQRPEMDEVAISAAQIQNAVTINPPWLSFSSQLRHGAIEEDAGASKEQSASAKSLEVASKQSPGDWKLGQVLLRYAVPVLLLTIMLAYAGWRLTRQPRPHSGIRSIAVLPLKNLSGDPAQDYFADGTSDELITELARVPGLRVVSWNSAVQEKDTKKPLKTIAGELQADLLVEGSVSRSGDKVRINAQLIDTKNDAHLWADSFEGPLGEVMALESKAAAEIAAHARAGTGEPASGVSAPMLTAIDPAAHDAYLRGRYYFDRRQDWDSVEQFQRAIDLSPNYASAYAGLAVALQSVAFLGDVHPDQIVTKAMAAVDKALELDPNNGDALIARGAIEGTFLWAWDAAERDLTRGIALSPNNTYGYMMLSVYLDSVGRPEDAVQQMRKAVEIDPLSFFMARHLGSTLYYARHYDEALHQLNYAREMSPASAGTVDHWLTDIYEKKGMYDEAVRYDLLQLQHDHESHDPRKLLAAYHHNGWKKYWAARLKSIPSDTSNPCSGHYAGITAIRAGRYDEALISLKRATKEHCFWMGVVQVDPAFDDLRANPGLSEIVAELNLPPAARP